MQQPCLHILSRLDAEPQLILMLSVWYCWWKIKHCWMLLLKALHLPMCWERPLRGSRITRLHLFVHRFFPQMHLSAPTLLILLTWWVTWKDPRRRYAECVVEWKCGMKKKTVVCNKHNSLVLHSQVSSYERCYTAWVVNVSFDVMVHHIITSDIEMLRSGFSIKYIAKK